MENGEAPQTIEEKKLTGKQRKFADHYIASLNATRSAEAAGYTGTYFTLAQMGSENLRKPHIRAYIERQLSAVAATPNEVLITLTNQMRFAIGDLLSEDGGIDIKEVKRRGLDSLIKEFVVEETVDAESGDITRTFKVKVYDAQSAADKLAKAHKLYVQPIELSGKDGKPLNILTNVIIEPVTSQIPRPPEPDEKDDE